MAEAGAEKWRLEFLNQTVLDEFEAFPLDIQAKFYRIWELIEEFGLPAVREPYITRIEGKIYEFRMKGRDGIGRSLFMTLAPKRVIVLRSFIKKANKTPKGEIKLARQRAKLAQ